MTAAATRRLSCPTTGDGRSPLVSGMCHVLEPHTIAAKERALVITAQAANISSGTRPWRIPRA